MLFSFYFFSNVSLYLTMEHLALWDFDICINLSYYVKINQNLKSFFFLKKNPYVLFFLLVSPTLLNSHFSFDFNFIGKMLLQITVSKVEPELEGF